ncbi:MAG TPA: hypothetical protein VFS25_06180 [Chitinophaga sp.]|uniref:hypothetical protein n=1 Tax=Chitinophaga sp. TaxID=1869181 RepID=UPI002DBCDBC8|nr:hypothetical protein [Chitinophaga sp.]HEU4552398.1 hypothetical protein [Chitinophaga sp.]
MYNQLRSYFLTLLAVLYVTLAAAQQTSLPAAFTGNWLSTDGSNRFVIGLYKNIACYRNNVQNITAVSGSNNHWRLTLSNARLDLVLQDAHTLVLTTNGRAQTLKNIRTGNHAGKITRQPLQQPLFREGTATVKGWLQPPARPKPGLRYSYVLASYENVLTGEEEYFPANLDKNGRFTLSFPVYKLQRCTLFYGMGEVATFFVEPGSTLLLAVNPGVKAGGPDPDYNQVMQRVCMMGDNAAFNNWYQHFLAYRSTLPDTAYTRNMAALAQVYASSGAPQHFIDYITAEMRYDYAYKRLSDMRDADTLVLRQLYQNYLAPGLPYAVIHDNFYRVAGHYADKLRKNFRVHYRFTIDKIAPRVNNEYSRLLSPAFIRAFNLLQKNWDKVSKMKDAEIIQTYFNGNKEAAIAYAYLFRKIENEFFKEARDSIAYAQNAALLKNPALNFAANLYQLQYNDVAEDELRTPSIYRLNIFKTTAARNAMPWELTVRLNRKQAVQAAGATIQLKTDSTRIREVNNEADWQAALKSYRGKVVVISMFDHYFEKKYAVRILYELEKMQAIYKGKNVVFLKCIVQRQPIDKARQLFGYLQLMSSQNQLQNLFYINGKISAMAVMKNGIEDAFGIYNTAGEAHHPEIYPQKPPDSGQPDISLTAELNAVLAGKGRYYESNAATYFTKRAGNEHSYFPRKNGVLKTWTRTDTAGAYEVYTATQPDMPDYETGDSVYRQLHFLADTTCVEARLTLHKTPAEKISRMFYSSGYDKEVTRNGVYHYRFNKPGRQLQLYNGKKPEAPVKRYRVAMIGTDIMVLERME